MKVIIAVALIVTVGVIMNKVNVYVIVGKIIAKKKKMAHVVVHVNVKNVKKIMKIAVNKKIIAVVKIAIVVVRNKMVNVYVNAEIKVVKNKKRVNVVAHVIVIKKIVVIAVVAKKKHKLEFLFVNNFLNQQNNIINN